LGGKNQSGGKIMMKKVWPVLLAVVLVFGFAVLGCGGGGSGPEEPPPPPEGPQPLFTLELTDNFQYGDGYQGIITDILKAAKNKTGDIAGKIEAGQTYAMRIKFTASRPLEDDLQIGLVDPSPAANYWKALSWDPDDEDTTCMFDMDEVNNATVNATVDEPAALTYQFEILASATSDAGAANCLVFQTKGEGTKGTSGSGVKGKVTLSFYGFDFVKGTIEDLPEEGTPPPPPPPEETYSGTKAIITVGETTQDVEVSAVSGEVVYFDDDSGYKFKRDAPWQASYAWFAVDFAAGEKLSDYEKVTFTYQGISGDIGYKNIVLVAKDEAFSVSLGSDGDVTAAAVSPQKSVDGTDATNVTLPLVRSKVAAYDTSAKVYFTIFFNANASSANDNNHNVTGPTTFQISNIAFVKGAVEITGITVRSGTAKTAYEVGETFDPALSLTATYSNETTDVIAYSEGNAADFGFTAVDEDGDDVALTSPFAAEGTVTVTVTYGGKTATFNVTVTAEPIVEPDWSDPAAIIEDYAVVEFTTWNEQNGNFANWIIDVADLEEADYFVFITDGSLTGANTDGFGGIKIGWQRNSNSYGMSTGISAKGWTGLSRPGVCYFFIKLSEIEAYTETPAYDDDTNVRFYIGYWGGDGNTFTPLAATGEAALLKVGFTPAPTAIDVAIATDGGDELGFVIKE
jgi:hypothetical protein